MAISIFSKPNTNIGFSPFFLNHGYEFNPIQFDNLKPSKESENKDPSSIKEVNQVIQRLKEASEIA